jgi:hypothetical protein
MHSVLVAFLSLFGLYLLQAALEFWRNVRAVGCVPGLELQPRNDMTESYPGRHLSGPRVIICPLPGVPQLLRRALPPFRFLVRENEWMIKSGYQGMDMLVSSRYHMRITERRICRCRAGCLCHGKFTAQYEEGRELRTLVYQVSVWPSRPAIFLADPAAIKVRDIPPRTGSI